MTVTGTTEASNSFAAKKASVVKGMDDVCDIAQPVAVLTRELLDDRLLLDLTEVLHKFRQWLAGQGQPCLDRPAPETRRLQANVVLAATRLSITEPLAVLACARASWREYEVPTQPASNYKIEREITPYAGIDPRSVQLTLRASF